ncbi:MAG: glutamate formimidoyltransferase [Acholeplasmataceae bacterium]|jgi:glutamate formiminotransferase|nr:glutamate formimidoyltransferase [Acholeplasmataceae bacterium]
MAKIVQCVPNISEGKDLKIIEYIIEPLINQEGFKLISAEPDQNYHRTVITLIGDPDQMIEPLLAFFKRAEEKIDLNKHKGEHPRMGAVDVLPFIPISGVTIDECISYATLMGEKISKMLNIPVYLYAKAAKQPNRVNLPDIRKGEFEGMKDKIKDIEWLPDFGPAEIHKTFGCVAVGARNPLIAYNIDLDTSDEKIAGAIAKAIRQSSGGFQYVQAGPAFIEDKGFVQVTMNILDYKKNPIYRILETVKMEAKRYHVNVVSSEVVGLLPKETLVDSIKYYEQVNGIIFNKTMDLDEITHKAIQYIGLRDFDQLKIIEANL